MSVNAVVINSPATVEFTSGLKSPWGRHLIVDQTGNGNHTTITAALAEVAAATPATGNRWLVDVLAGVYSETITIPSYVTLRCPAGKLCTITGGFDTPDGAGGYTTTPTITMHGRASLEGGNVETTGLVCIRMVCDTAGVTPSITGSYIQAWANRNGVATCVEIEGTVFSGAYADVMHCPVIYARNAHAGANAKAVVFRLMPGGAALRAHGNHYKISSGPGGAAERYLAWNQGDHAYAQMDVSGDLAIYNGGEVYLMYNDNTLAQHGGRVFCPVSGWVDEYSIPANYSVPVGVIYDPRPSAESNLCRLKVLSLDTNALAVDGQPFTSDPPLASGQWFHASEWVLGSGTNNPAVGVGRTFPVRFRYNTTLSAVRLEVVTAAASSVVRVAIYADDGNGNPGSKLAELGATASGAVVGFVEIASSFAFTGGAIYHIYTGVEGAAATWRTHSGHAPWVPQLGTGTSLGHTATHTTGSTPATFVSTGYTGAPLRVQFKPA